ncbi:septum formation family protein [Microbacterium sp. HJ5]
MHTTRRLGALAAASVAAALTLTGCSVIDSIFPAGAERDDSGEIAESGQLDVFTITVGDCLADAPEGEVSEVAAVPCGEPHAFEAYHDFQLTGDEFPGADVVDEQAWTTCEEAFTEFVGLTYDESVLLATYYTPTEESWNSLDDRTVTCLIGEESGETTGSLADAAR